MAAEPAGTGMPGADLFVAYALAQLLVLKGGNPLAALAQLTPWRQDLPVTAGRCALPCSGF